MKKIILLSLVAAVVATVPATAQGVMYVVNNRVGVGTSNPTGDFHLENVDGIGDTVYKLVSATGNWNLGVRASNGVFTFNKVGTPQEFTVREANNPTATLDVAGHVRGTSFKSTSSRALKTSFEALDSNWVLATLAELPVTSWRYKSEDETVRHYGPVAEDFQRLFGLGDGKTITSVDADGVLMAAVKGLKQQVDARDAEIAQMKQVNADLEARLAALEARLTESH